VIVVNFKTYLQATGEKAVALSQVCVNVSKSTGVRIVVCPQLGDIRACKETGIECFAQHTDAVEPDRHTGYVTIEEVLATGATGTLLNHSEHRIPVDGIKMMLERIKRFTNFQICVCAATLEETISFSKMFPTFISYEPPELIGSRDKSVATEKPEVVAAAVDAVPIPLLIGAGIHSAEDVKVAVKLQAKGILVSSGVVLASNPESVLQELASAFKVS
jgi:triosephosphate isomerase (TIM)